MSMTLLTITKRIAALMVKEPDYLPMDCDGYQELCSLADAGHFSTESESYSAIPNREWAVAFHREHLTNFLAIGEKEMAWECFVSLTHLDKVFFDDYLYEGMKECLLETVESLN